MRSHFVFAAAIVALVAIFTNVRFAKCAPSSALLNLQTRCVHSLKRPASFFKRHFDAAFLKKFLKHLVPFTDKARVKMQFFLYKRDFRECGREIITEDDDTLHMSGFNADHPTRIIIHGWMSQSKGSFNRAVKNAYLSLTKSPQSSSSMPSASAPPQNQSTNNTIISEDKAAIDAPTLYTANSTDTIASAAATELLVHNASDYNVIVVDWSVISSNVNYFGVVDLIEDLGFLLTSFVRYLHKRTNLHFDDVYLIGHSLGAQIAGSAGKQIQPFRFNTIYALDPAGPKFRELSDEFRLDPTDAVYVESIQTSSSLGFQEPVGHATFYPNYGRSQKKCYIYSCSHSRAHDYFAESITSSKGFWGTLCRRESEDIWIMSDSGVEFRMGGEPSTPKRGTFYVKTNSKPPYAMGKRRRMDEVLVEEAIKKD